MEKLNKKGKIILLPTTEKTNLLLTNNGTLIHHSFNNKFRYADEHYQHLHIVNDDKIEENDWYILLMDSNNHELHQFGKNDKSGINFKEINSWTKSCKKIIASTDNLCIGYVNDYDPRSKTGGAPIWLPQPSPQFIQKYCDEYDKGNQITEIMVEYAKKYNQPVTKNYEKTGDLFITEEVKIDKTNCITITKIKDSWNREEVENLIYTAMKDRCYTTVAEWQQWLKDNL